MFTPCKNAWLKKVDSFYLKPYPVARYADALAPLPGGEPPAIPSLDTLGFVKTNCRR